ncbi:MAG: hypothetical protein IJL87_07340 [Clostridia bacterium]|nr:hypothetical protein [Clostridia bacterium]
MKRLTAVFLAAAFILALVCSCGKKKATTFDFTLEKFIEGFNEVNTELPDIDREAVQKIQAQDGNVFAEYDFTDGLRFCAYSDPKTNNVQKLIMWLLPHAIEDKENAYKFAAYNAIMLSSFVSSQEEYEKIVGELSLDSNLEFNTDKLYKGDNFAVYYSYDAYGYRLIVTTIADMEQIEAEAAAAAESK